MKSPTTPAVSSAIELQPALRDECRFADCTHRSEPECAVRDALAAGKLDRERYESYLKLREELEGLEAGQW